MDISVITRGFHTGVQVIKAHKSEIAWGLSMALRIAAIVKCVHDVTTSDDILDEYHKKSEEIEFVKEMVESGTEVYANEERKELITPEDIKKDEKKLALRTVVKLVDHFKWTMIFEAGSIALDTYGFFSMRKTAVTAIGGLAAANEFIKKYRGRIVEECGKDIDFYAATGLKKVNKNEMPDISTPDGEPRKDLFEHWDDNSDYCAFFTEQSTPYWRNNLNLNIGYLKGLERMATNKLRAQGYLFLNDVLDSLGLPETEAGCFIGWLYNSEDGDNFVDFGIGTEGEHYIYGDDVYDACPDVALNFNCVGVITHRFTKFSRK